MTNLIDGFKSFFKICSYTCIINVFKMSPRHAGYDRNSLEMTLIVMKMILKNDAPESKTELLQKLKRFSDMLQSKYR